MPAELEALNGGEEGANQDLLFTTPPSPSSPPLLPLHTCRCLMQRGSGRKEQKGASPINSCLCMQRGFHIPPPPLQRHLLLNKTLLIRAATR